MGRFFRGVIELSTSSLKETFKLLCFRLNLRPYNKLDKKVKDFKDL
jgi:hypothetical protein